MFSEFGLLLRKRVGQQPDHTILRLSESLHGFGPPEGRLYSNSPTPHVLRALLVGRFRVGWLRLVG